MLPENKARGIIPVSTTTCSEKQIKWHNS